jgi:hypothetical protein
MFRTVNILLIILILLLYLNMKHYMSVKALSTDTIQRVLHNILKQMDSILVINSPPMALIQIRECQSALQTLIQVVGGETTLETIGGINIEQLQNILYFQEQQVQEFAQDENHSHINV